jgi:hypothetical protein
MRAKPTGSAAMLMFVFLGVIAVVGVFGIPQFAPVVASPSRGADSWSSEEFSPLEGEAGGGPIVQGTEDLFAPIDHERPSRQTQAGNRLADSRKPSTNLPDEALDGWALHSQPGGASVVRGERKQNLRLGRRRSSATKEDRPPANLKLLAFGEPSAAPEESGQSIPPSFAEAVPSPGRKAAVVHHNHEEQNTLAFGTDDNTHPSGLLPSRQIAADRTAGSGGVVPKATSRQDLEPLTWRTAVERLNSLGIRHFRLSPGERMQEYQFSCIYTPADNPRITYRFEAEAGEPLEAVKKVLAQIDDWLAKH